MCQYKEIHIFEPGRLLHAKIDDFLDELVCLGKTASHDAVWKLSTAYFSQNGFDKLIYLDARPDGLTMRTTLSTVWVERYEACNYADIDPFFTHCGKTYRPVSTGVAYADSHEYLSIEQKALIYEAAEFGMNAGFSCMIRLAGPSGGAGWNIGSSLSRKDIDALRGDRGADLRLAAHHAHDALVRAHYAGTSTALSKREAECLLLLSQGHRTKDIARTLMISPVAVELYLRNARNKLGARTRDQAVALAISQGLLLH